MNVSRRKPCLFGTVLRRMSQFLQLPNTGKPFEWAALSARDVLSQTH